MAIEKLQTPQRQFGQPIPVAPDTNAEVAKINELVEAVNSGLGVSNAVVGAPKFVRYRDSRLYGVTAADLTLDKLEPSTILPGNLATVINPADNPTSDTLPPRQYVATLAAAGTEGAVGVPAYLGATQTVPVVWQAVESASAFAPLLTSELNKEKAAYAGLELHPLLVKIVNALGGAVTTVVTQPAVPAPEAPTNGQVNDVSKEFSFTVNPAYPSYIQYLAAGLPGSTGAVALSPANAYQVGRTVYLKVGSAVAKGNLAVYVSGSGTMPAGKVLVNGEAFTGAASTTPVNSPPAVQVSVAGSASVPQFTASAADADGIKSIFLKVFAAAGGAAVQTFGPSAPGDTSYVASWVSAPAGSYLLRAIATDQKDLSATSEAVAFTVTAPGPATAPKGYQATYTDTIPSDAT